MARPKLDDHKLVGTLVAFGAKLPVFLIDGANGCEDLNACLERRRELFEAGLATSNVDRAIGECWSKEMVKQHLPGASAIIVHGKMGKVDSHAAA